LQVKATWQVYRGDVSNNVAARKRIPNADKPVSMRLTRGFAKVVVARPIMLIRNEYHDAEVSAQKIERIKIPHPKLKSEGTNCGIKATAKTAAFTFVKLVINPSRKAGPSPVFAVPS